MKWQEFERKVKKRNIYLFNMEDVKHILGTTKIATRFLIHRWTKKGFIVRLKRGLYYFSDSRIPDLYLANKLYEPSYISLEFALSYHRIIPEAVYAVTSVTPRVTRTFNRSNRQFIYRRIKASAFTGYMPLRQHGFTFNIAEPEKAFVDLLYLRIVRHKKPISRFAKNKLNRKKVLRYADMFNNKKLQAMARTTLQ